MARARFEKLRGIGLATLAGIGVFIGATLVMGQPIIGDPAVPSVVVEPAADGTVTLTPVTNFFIETLRSIVNAVIGILATWAAYRFHQVTGVRIESGLRDSLQTSVTNAAGKLIGALGPKIHGMTITIGNPEVAKAIQYVIDNAPDAIRHWGLSEAQIAEKIIAKVPILAPPPPPKTEPPVTAGAPGSG